VAGGCARRTGSVPSQPPWWILLAILMLFPDLSLYRPRTMK
jgi:hypothetical protein